MPAQVDHLATLKTALDDLCHNTLRLRIAIAVVLAVLWYFAVYSPLTGRIEAARTLLDTERRRLALAEDIEELRAETKRFHDRLPPRPDPNEAIQHLLQGVKALPVRLVSLDPATSKDIGPYKTVSVTLKAEGQYTDLDRMLRWIESNPRILRIESISIAPADGRGESGKVAGPAGPPQYKMDLEILGVIG
jgi:Tfp pilus assembly protein PilO